MANVLDLGAFAREAAALALGDMREQMRAIVREELERVTTDRFLDRNALAAYMSITPKALGARLRRGSQLMAVATVVDGRQVFKKSAVDAFIARGAR